jgi:hypothetical protein
MIKKTLLLLFMLLVVAWQTVGAQQRRPIDSQHPMWFIHVDVWYKADPQKIIDLIPEKIRPYVCLNLSLSCQYDTDKNVYKMPQYAFQTYKSWATVCQKNGMWFSCQPASGGHTHIQDDDMVTFEYFFKTFPNFLGWNYAEQFWGFNEAGDKSSSTQTSRWALFGRLVEMSHKYGGLLTVSFCGNIWSHGLNPIGELKRDAGFLEACKKYPEAILFLYKYTTSSCFYNNESVTFGPFISGLTKAYGVRYDNCGWKGAMDAIFGEPSGKGYPAAAGVGTVMEQMGVNGASVWDGPELTWSQECFRESGTSTVDGYTRRNWARFPIFEGVWQDMFYRVINGQIYIPSREEVVGKTKIVVINDITSGDDQAKYATWDDLYDGVYKMSDPMNRNNGRWMDNYCYFKSTGRYGAIPMVTDLYDDLAKSIPVQVKKSNYTSRWSTTTKKTADFNTQYPKVSTGDMYVNRYRNQLITYNPHSYLVAPKKQRAKATIPLKYNTCENLILNYDLLSSALIREFSDSMYIYMNNYRTDSTAFRTDTIIITGVTEQPTRRIVKHGAAQNAGSMTADLKYDAETQTAECVVKHCGPLELYIKCKGNADRSDATDAIAITPLPQPKQPEEWRGEILIEAEDMDYRSINSCCTDPYTWYPNVIGHSANGFVDMGTNTSGSLRHTLKLSENQAGNYKIGVRYMCTAKNTTLGINVNDGARKFATCKKTQNNEWRWATIDATLQKGDNTLVITNVNGVSMYIDQISYLPEGVEPMKYYVNVNSAKGGTVTPDIDEAKEGDTITLSVQTKKGYELTELRVVNSVFYTLEKTITIDESGDIKFCMPNDNVTLEPVFTNTAAVYKVDFANTVGGKMPEGWRCVQEDNTVHSYPNTYSTGARIMSGFAGCDGNALYWRNNCAEYGRQSAYPLTLVPGRYTLNFAMAAWKESPSYKVQILNATTGTSIAASNVLSAAPNANGNSAANLSSATPQTLEFTVSEAGNYIISFTDQTTWGGYHEFLLCDCNLVIDEEYTGIRLTTADDAATPATFDVLGRSTNSLRRGINIIRTADGKVKKVMIER